MECMKTLYSKENGCLHASLGENSEMTQHCSYNHFRDMVSINNVTLFMHMTSITFHSVTARQRK